MVMRHVARGWVLGMAVGVVGCATGVRLRVTPVAYQRVTPDVQAKTGVKEAQELAAARKAAERARSDEGAARHDVAVAVEASRAAHAATLNARSALAAATDPLRKDQARVDVDVAEAGEQVAATQQRLAEATLGWRESVSHAAALRIEAADAALELARAEALSRYDGELDVAPYRGQYASLRHDYQVATQRVATSHTVEDRVQRDLAAAKDRYAAARRVMLPKPVIPPPPPVVIDANQPATAAR